MNSLFYNPERPVLVAMLKEKSVDGLLDEIAKIHIQGTDAFGFQIDMLNPEQRNKESYKKLFDAMNGKPCYVTNYCRGNEVEHTDEELTDELLEAVECGAKLIDIRCDLYDRQDGEYTDDEVAVGKQKETIQKIHRMGAEVLMSDHVLRYISGDEVLKIAKAQKERGADVIKIVTDANSDAELYDNFKTVIRLKEEFDIPVLFLCNGSHCAKHRILAPALGVDLFLVTENSQTGQTQPTIARAKEMLRAAGYKNLP